MWWRIQGYPLGRQLPKFVCVPGAPLDPSIKYYIKLILLIQKYLFYMHRCLHYDSCDINSSGSRKGAEGAMVPPEL